MMDCSNSSHEHQNEHDQEDKSKPAAGIISPTFAVRPCRQGAKKYENQNDGEYESHDYFPSLPGRTGSRREHAILPCVVNGDLFIELRELRTLQ